MKDSYMAWTEWWMDLWVEHPWAFFIAVVAGIFITRLNNIHQRRRRK